MGKHLISAERQYFLTQNRKDPITGDEFLLGDKIVFCASCKSAFHIDSWEYIGGVHCGQNGTLSRFPAQKKMRIRKSSYDFKPPTTFEFWMSSLIDTLICGAIAVLLNTFLRFSFDYEHLVILLFGVFYVLKDVFLIQNSIGNALLGLTFLSEETNRKAGFIKLLFRNVFPVGVVIGAFFLFDYVFEGQMNDAPRQLTLSFTVILSMLVVHFAYFASTGTSTIDMLLGIKLAQKPKIENS